MKIAEIFLENESFSGLVSVLKKGYDVGLVRPLLYNSLRSPDTILFSSLRNPPFNISSDLPPGIYISSLVKCNTYIGLSHSLSPKLVMMDWTPSPVSDGRQLKAAQGRPSRGSGATPERGASVSHRKRGQDTTKIANAKSGFTGGQLFQALDYAANFLRQNCISLSFIATGSTVKNIQSGSGQTMGEVNFLPTHTLSLAEHNLYRKAAAYAVEKCSFPLGAEWLSDRFTKKFPEPLRARFVEESINQNVVVFEKPGLKVFAASWKYSFASELSRLHLNGDAKEAVTYLRQHISLHQGEQVPFELIREWLGELKKAPQKPVIEYVNRQYRVVHRKDGVSFSP